MSKNNADNLMIVGIIFWIMYYFCGWLQGLRPQAQRSAKPMTTPPRSRSWAPVPRLGINFLDGSRGCGRKRSAAF